MAILSGDILPLNQLDPMIHAVTATVLVKQGRKTVASGTVTDDNSFVIELPDGLVGDVEVSLGLHNAAPSIATLDGTDLHITLLYSNVNNYLA